MRVAIETTCFPYFKDRWRSRGKEGLKKEGDSKPEQV